MWRNSGQTADLFYAALQSLVAVAAPTAPVGLGYQSPFFRDHIHDPSIFASASPATLATNFLLALILALAMGFFGNLLNATLEANEDEVARLLGPFSRASIVRGTKRHSQHELAAASTGVGLDAIADSPIVDCVWHHLRFVDPSFDPRQPDAILVVFALTVSVGLISLVDDMAQFVVLKRYGEYRYAIHEGTGFSL